MRRKIKKKKNGGWRKRRKIKKRRKENGGWRKRRKRRKNVGWRKRWKKNVGWRKRRKKVECKKKKEEEKNKEEEEWRLKKEEENKEDENWRLYRVQEQKKIYTDDSECIQDNTPSDSKWKHLNYSLKLALIMCRLTTTTKKNKKMLNGMECYW